MMHIGDIVTTTGRMIKLEFVTGDYGYQAEMLSPCMPPVPSAVAIPRKQNTPLRYAERMPPLPVM
jgi:hypothetical protein